MKLRVKIHICFLLLFCSHSFGQISNYNYKREVKGISEQWHRIPLPNEIFGKVSANLRDFRIFGITTDNDTIETPYLLRSTIGKLSEKQISYKLLNVSNNENGYYFTFEIPITEPVNQIDLNFTQQNFDWQIKLEGSHNQNEWFTIIDDYRIISIKNHLTDFHFSKLTFPDSKYRFFRVSVNSNEKPELIAASIIQNEAERGINRNYPIKKINIKENTKTKQTEIDLELQLPVPVNQLKIDIQNQYDYYRPITITYLADSFKTEHGWKYNYNTLTSEIVSSIRENEFTFNSTITQKLRIHIHNQDNSPLTIGSIQISGHIYELVVRFTEQASYFLVYGNKKATIPNYDIDRFTEKIPKTLTELELGKEQQIKKEERKVSTPLFQNKLWLWGVMALIIILLGWFSLSMIRKNH